ncbi:hypothetical protein AB1N83_011011 [Pleurotus pulmonarius]
MPIVDVRRLRLVVEVHLQSMYAVSCRMSKESGLADSRIERSSNSESSVSRSRWAPSFNIATASGSANTRLAGRSTSGGRKYAAMWKGARECGNWYWPIIVGML